MSEAKQIYHVPVLLNESVDGMNIQPGGYLCRCHFRRRRTFQGNSKPAG